MSGQLITENENHAAKTLGVPVHIRTRYP